RLFILPVLGLALFAGQSYRSFHEQWRTLKRGGQCFCWASVPLDTRPSERSGSRNLTACESLRELNSYTDLGCGRSRFPTVLLMFSALPAFLVSTGVVRALAKLGTNEVTSFMVVTPCLIFAWYYFVSVLLGRVVRRRKLRVLVTSH